MKISIRDMSYIGIFVALMVVGVFIKIPTPFVPITFQLFFCVFAGVFLGSVKGLISQLVYIALGLFGLPIFTGGGGFNYIFKSTFGFIIGFAVCAFLVGLILERMKKKSVVGIFLASIIGVLASYFIGILYMYMILTVVNGVSASLFAITMGMSLYLLKDIILCVVIAVVSVSVLKRMNKAGLGRVEELA